MFAWIAMLALVAAQTDAAPAATPAGQSAPGPAAKRADVLAYLRAYDFAEHAANALTEVPALAQRVLDDPRASAVDRAEANAAIGYAHFYNYQYPEALERLEAARDLYERAGETKRPEYAALLAESGQALTALGRFDDAIARLEMSVAKTASVNGVGSPAHSAAIFALASLKYQTGDLPGGIALMEQSVAYGRANEARGVVDTDLPVYMMSVAALLDLAGQIERAVTYAAEAVSVSERSLGATHGTTVTALHNLGSLLSHAGRYAEAEPVLRRALDLRAAQAGPKSPDTARTMHNLAKLLHRTGRYDEAEALYSAAIEIYDANPDTMSPETVGEMQLNLASVTEGRGNLTRALALREAALARLTTSLKPGHRSLGRGELEVARNRYLLGDAAGARAGIDRALPALVGDHGPTEPIRFAASVLAARLAADAGDAHARADALELARAIETELLSPAAPGGERADRFTRYQEPLIRLAETLLRLGETDAGFRVAQLARTAEIDEAANRLAARLAAGSDDGAALLRELQDQDEAARATAAKLNAAIASGDAARATLDAELQATREKMRATRAKLAERYPERIFAPVTRPRTVAEAQAALAPGEAALYALPRIDGVLSLLVSARGLEWRHNALPRPALAEAVAALRRSTDAARGEGGKLPAFDYAAAHRLYAAATPWDGAPPAAIRHLTVQASGPLASVPFAALVTRAYAGPGRAAPWLVKRMAVSVPLAGDVRRTATSGGAALSFAGVGDPTLTGKAGQAVETASLMRGGSVDVRALGELPRLPSAGAELRAMFAFFGGNGVLVTGADATERWIKRADLSRYRVLAFATHGLVGGDLEGLGEPALVLTPPAQADADDDGLLTASEIARLRLDADWVILSACNTAAPSGVAQTTYSGLARAFVQAGARSLLLSHWPVRDDVAARLSVETVKGAMRGEDRAEALRRAQLRLIADAKVPDGDHPAIWAPYILVGD